MKTAVSSLLVASIRHLIAADPYPSYCRTERNPFALKDLPCTPTRPYKMLLSQAVDSEWGRWLMMVVLHT